MFGATVGAVHSRCRAFIARGFCPERRLAGTASLESRHETPDLQLPGAAARHHDRRGGGARQHLALPRGARQVECTVNGIGERAGNASLEEVVMALDTRHDIFRFSTGVRKSALCESSRLVSRLTGMVVQPNKAIVGRNAFAHESGIHQHGVIAKRNTYEIIRPQDVGFGESNLVLGKHSGRHAFALKAKKLGYKLTAKELDECFKRFKDLADMKKEVFEDDLRAIIESVEWKDTKEYTLEYLKVVSETGKRPIAKIKIKHRSKVLSGSGTGDGPVDAAYNTLDKLLGLKLKLLDYAIQAVTVGKDAQGEVTALIRSPQGQECRGRGTSTDVIQASVIAYLDAANRIRSLQQRQDLPHV